MAGSSNKVTKSRLAKSANVERDLIHAQFDGYIPTGRVLDVLQRIASGMVDASSGRAFSITGPYGSGKSSFAVFLHALFADYSDDNFKHAYEVLRSADAKLATTWMQARQIFEPANAGIKKFFVTAKAEPLVSTLRRALDDSEVTGSSSRSKRKIQDPLKHISNVAKDAPVVILIDEFGKNLEAFGDSRAQGDPYLLQEIAEMSQGAKALPIVIITMQHLAFDEYVIDAGSSERREWAKVQGRFHDIGFIDSPEQSYFLIASAFEKQPKNLSDALQIWYKKCNRNLSKLGLDSVLDFAKDSYPLHPASLVALPDLCSRFGQNERTLFSFLSGNEPGALPTLAENFKSESGLTFVGLDAIYDYFVGSASSFIGASHAASRWIEIETRIRDASRLSPDELKLLKTIGVLNLLSAGGALRASSGLLERLWLDTKCQGKYELALASLVDKGFITYRDFADEFRIWAGSDFNLKNAIESQRRNLSAIPTSELLQGVITLEPVVAGRNSQRTGILRVFPRLICGTHVDLEQFEQLDQSLDGAILLFQNQVPATISLAYSRPVVHVYGSTDVELREAAIEVRSLRFVLEDLQNQSTDWVAIHELGERLSHASNRLQELLEEYWSPQSASWYYQFGNSELVEIPKFRNVSSLCSWVADQVYTATPRVANEMIARRELTSQGAKARRTLVDALFMNSTQETLAIEGYGPERAMYEAILKGPGIHKFDNDSSSWTLQNPTAREWKPIWKVFEKQLVKSQVERISLTEFVKPLSEPPFGLKDGLLGLLSAVFVKQKYDDIALYEYGSLVLSVDDAIIERMLRNPEVFSIRNTGVSAGIRHEVVQSLRSRLQMPVNTNSSSFLQLARALFRELRTLEPYTQQTNFHLSDTAKQVRKSFKEAVEPDRLIFETIPVALSTLPFEPSKSSGKSDVVSTFANRFIDVVLELKQTYPSLLNRIERAIGESLSVGSSVVDYRKRVSGQAVNLLESILQPKLKTFAFALSREDLDDKSWLENVAMVVSEGLPPRMWTDEHESKFQMQIMELGSNFRRLQALLYDRLATTSDGYETRRITITWPDGTEISESVALSSKEMSVMSDTLGADVAKLTQVFGSEFEARKALAAWLWMDVSAPQVSRNDVPISRGEASGE